MKLEIRTSPNGGAELDIHYLPNVTRYEDRSRMVSVDVYMSNHSNSVLNKMGWGFDYDIGGDDINDGINPTIAFKTDGTKITTETMLAVLRGFFGERYSIEVDPTNLAYDPEKEIEAYVHFLLKVIPRD